MHFRLSLGNLNFIPKYACPIAHGCVDEDNATLTEIKAGFMQGLKTEHTGDGRKWRRRIQVADPSPWRD